MLFERKLATQPVATTQVRSDPANSLRSGLGMLTTWKVNRIEQKAKAEAAGHLVQRTIEVSLDVAETQLEADATNMKTALTARAVPIMGALMEEVTVRAGQVRLGLQNAEKHGMENQIEFRHQAQSEMAVLHERGFLTADELAEVQVYVAGMATKGISRLSHDMNRVHEALNAHLDRVVDHVKSPERKG
jgi:hypothetical protein